MYDTDDLEEKFSSLRNFKTNLCFKDDRILTTNYVDWFVIKTANECLSKIYLKMHTIFGNALNKF